MIDLSWLSAPLEALWTFFPRREIVRNTHGGVRWSLWRKPREVRPGVRWYWPLITDMEIIPTARQPTSLPIQSLTTADGIEVAVSGTLACHVVNVLLAIGEKNYDIDETIGERGKVAIAKLVMNSKYEDLLADDVEKQLTEVCRAELRKYGVQVDNAALTDFTTCRPLNLIGIPDPAQPQ